MLIIGMKKLFIILGLLCYLSTANAQVLVQEKLYKLGNTFRSFGNSTLTKQGNVLIAGGSISSPSHQSLLILINPNGDSIWTKNGPLVSTGGFGVKQSPNNEIVLYTTKRYTSPAASGTVLQKYDGNGQLKLTMPYQTNSFDVGHSLLTAPDSGYYLGGKAIITGKNRRFALSRTDSLGNLKWRKSYDWNLNDFYSDMQHTLNGNIIMYGITEVPQRLKLLIVNQQGDSVLGRKLTIIGSPTRNERILSASCGVTPLSDGGFAMAAEIDTSVAGAAPELGMVVKVDASLQPVWHYINRSVPDNISFTSSRELTDGSIIMLGFERKGAASTPGNKFFLYRFSATGSLINVYTFNSTIATQVQAHTLEALPADSSFIIGGSGLVTPFPNQSIGFYVAKVKIPGLPPAFQLPGPTLVTGLKSDVASIKAYLGQNYPNPTTTEAIIPFSLPKDCKSAIISIREVATGREIKKYDLKRGESSLKVNLSSFSNGLYLYSLIVDDKPIATKKLAVMK